MQNYRIYLVDARDNSNMGHEDIEIEDDADPMAEAQKLLKEGQAIDQIAHITIRES